MAARRTTLADVAREAGVSQTTASFVLSGRGHEMRISTPVQEMVRDAARRANYRPNIVSRGLRTGTTSTLGFISDSVATTRFAGDLINGALQRARNNGQQLFITETGGVRGVQRELILAMLDRQVDGLVLASMYTRKTSVPPELHQAPAAVLLNALAGARSTVPSVIPDETSAGRAVAQLLLDAGFRNDIHLLGQLDHVLPGAIALHDRLAGISATFSTAGVELCASEPCANWDPLEGYRVTARILSKHQPQALICLNDRLAFGAYQAIAEARLTIPDDISVISFDDDPLAAWLRPGLTSVALPHYELGRTAIDVISGGRILPDVIVDGSIYRVPMPMRERDSVRFSG